MTTFASFTLALTLRLVVGVEVPNVKLRNGVEMPMLATGVYQYNSSEAYASISAWLQVGGRSIDTALDYNNQDGVGKAMKDSGVDRKDIFLQTKVPGCLMGSNTHNPFKCYSDTAKGLAQDLQLLGLDYVDSVILHFPPAPTFVVRSCGDLTGSCEMIRGQWRAMEEFYKAGKARSIGVSNYCPSCFECLAKVDVFPFTNQVMFHVGMGPSAKAGFQQLLDYSKGKGVVTQAYSSLGNTPWTKKANPEILHGNVTSTVAKAHNVSAVEVALKYIVDKGIPSVTKSSNPAHLSSNLHIFSWQMTDDEHDVLEKYTLPHDSYFDKYSFACSASAADAVVV